MKSTLLYTLIIFLSGPAFGGNHSDSSNVPAYNKIKFDAENLILEDRYCESSEIYCELLDDFPIWNEDLQNALISSLYCNDLNRIEKFSLELLKRGAPHEFFENELDSFPFFQSEKWKEIKKLDIDFVFDPALRKIILEMRDRDQRDRYDEINRPLDDYLNLIELNKIIVEQGFPTQIDLGFDYYKSDLSYNRYFSNILLHLVKLQPWDFGEGLQDFYFDSKISSKDLVYLMAFARTCDDLQMTCLTQPPSNALFVDGVLFSCNEEEMKRVNENREIFFLDSVEEQIRKIEFRRENNEIPWKLDMGFAKFQYNFNKYDFDSISKKLSEEQGLVPYPGE